MWEREVAAQEGADVPQAGEDRVARIRQGFRRARHVAVVLALTR